MSIEQFSKGVAVVIGGTGGIGQAIVRRFVESNCPVAFTYRESSSRAEAICELLHTEDTPCESFQLNAVNYQHVHSLFDRIAGQREKIHTVINAAGSDISMEFVSELTPDHWTQHVETDLRSFFNITSVCIPHLRQSRGSIVQVSSIGIRRWPTRDALSVIPKAGIEALVKGIAREEGRFGVRANSVQLGVINAGLFLRLANDGLDSEWISAARANIPLRHFGEAIDVANAVAFLASKQARYITGESLRLDGGYSV